MQDLSSAGVANLPAGVLELDKADPLYCGQVRVVKGDERPDRSPAPEADDIAQVRGIRAGAAEHALLFKQPLSANGGDLFLHPDS